MPAAATTPVEPPGRDAFRDLFDALPIGAVLFDPATDGFLAFNDAACAQLGYDREAFAALRLSDVDASDGVDPLARRRALRPGAPPQRFSTLHRTRGGELRHVDVTVRGIVLDGRTVGFGVWHDVTERERATAALREREAELARVQRIGQLGGFEIDLRTGFANRRSPEYLQLHRLPDEAMHEPHEAWVRRLHPDDRARAERAFLDAVRGDAVEYANEYRTLLAGGEVRWIRALGEIERDADGRALRMVGAHLDVTDLRRAQTAAAERAERLLEADRRKDEFLAVLSHELRNPLSALTNAIALLGRADAPAAAPGAMLAIAQRQVRQLTRLVDDLLEVSRISAGKIVLRTERLPIADVVREAIDSLGGVLRDRGQTLTLQVTEPVPRWATLCVDADRARIVQVVENLLGNASKYSDDGGAIRVRLDAVAGEVEIVVEDDGVGIPPDALEEVFTLFAQVDAARDRSRGGLGIGLALVRRLVGLHGGTVDAHSDGPGRGARFTVRLPVA
ncbi:MAG TPA: ATP-binding protein [Burkholderiaceae bacterium]|nr:ATP-binding protein [Burkholderiaceae bacterium]